MTNEQPLYNKLKAQKANGQILNIKEVDYNTLKQLWHDEIVFDNELAALFNTSAYQVKKRRKELDISIHSITLKEIMEKLRTGNIILE